MQEFNVLSQCGLSIQLFEALSYYSSLPLSLKRTLRHFDKDELLRDVDQALAWYQVDGNKYLEKFGTKADYRIKSRSSARFKYLRYYPDRPANKVFNDLIGLRCICNTYADVLLLSSIPNLRIVDMSEGKANDDGYRGVHLYYQKSNHHYPIEIQYNTMFDRKFNDWLHNYLYKTTDNHSVGAQLRLAYESGIIKSIDEFKEVLHYVLSGSN